MSTIPTTNLLSQSPYLYLQGAGSDGTDGSAPGIHLRWDLNGTLAALHIPKGNLAAPGHEYYTTAGFNKADDFVKLYRTRYDRNYPIVINLLDTAPTTFETDPGKSRTWRYADIVPLHTLPENTCDVLIRFPNPIRYDQAKQLYDPAVNRIDFLKAYDDIIEVEVADRLMFAANIEMHFIDHTQETMTRIESISQTNKEGEELFISARRKYEPEIAWLKKEDEHLLQQETTDFFELEELQPGEGKIMAENIRYIRFHGTNAIPVLLWLQTYDDFLLAKNQTEDWEPVAQLSLSTDTTTVFDRLEKADKYRIDNIWRKYTPEAKVNVNNYKERWGKDANDGLQDGVIKYLDWSRAADNLRAENSPDPAGEEHEQEFGFSYLALLQLVASDFHIARMLGFGHIDTDISSDADDKYMYIAIYETTAALDDMPAALRTHTCMTLPVGKNDYKLPVAPELQPIEYGYSDNAVKMTDENGYNKYDDSRIVGLKVKSFNAIIPLGAFFIPDEEYDYVDCTEPVFYGIAYKALSEKGWRSPEINNDPDFQDSDGVNETVAIFREEREKENVSRIFTHIETQPGIHQYAIYSINCFSRVSSLSNTEQTDNTAFPIRNTLMPPLNMGVQLIQKENPLIFTTAAEQKRLAELASEDKTLVRVIFEWNNIQASNYWYGREAEFYFRTEPLNFIKGKIKSVVDLGQGIFDIHTQSYTVYSVKPNITYAPIVPAEKENRFIGSFLNTGDEQYTIINIRQSNIANEGSVFRVQAFDNRKIADPDLDNIHLSAVEFITPKAGEIISIAENTSLIDNWAVCLKQKITLTKFSDYTETDIDSEGNITEIHIGGIIENASITEFLDKDTNGNDIPNSKTGVYRVIFDNYILAPHPDKKVEWYKGTIRVKDNMGVMRTLEVYDIEKNNNIVKLQLIVHDASFRVDASYKPIDGYNPIPVGNAIAVNYHPGYRAYLTHEQGFDEAAILPPTGTGSRQTLFACRSLDNTNGLASPLSLPGVISAKEIVEPAKPEKPAGPLFATRPDFYGKATYTFDTEINTGNGTRAPYALLFYRANDQIILDTLYKHNTVLQIRNNLAQITNDTAFTSRWNELVNVIVDEADGRFKDWNGYRFPNPDNDEFTIPNRNPDILIRPFNSAKNPGNTELVEGTGMTYHDIVKLAINNAFLSLTEQPAVYAYLKNGEQTSAHKPVIRNSDGELIIPGTNGYDGAPMAVRVPQAAGKEETENIVRFTDYTLDGASNSFFFYYVMEMSNALTLSERSEILGPVQLINTNPPHAPEIRKFYTQTENRLTGDTPAVLFEINSYLETDSISGIRIYRATNAVAAFDIRTMQLAAKIEIGKPLVDHFSDIGFYPFGETLYYRLVAVRTIQTALADAGQNLYESEELISHASNLILTNIIDVNNPESPELSYTADENLTHDILTRVTLSWDMVKHGCTYRLLQMNSSGNWHELYAIKTNTSPMTYELPDQLVKKDEDGNLLYYRFKISVENSSGLFNLDEKILTI